MLNYIVKDLSEFSEAELRECFYQMLPSRKEKVLRYKYETQKKATVAGELSAKKLLSQSTGKSPYFFEIYPDENGKLRQDNHEKLFFNISHSENKVACVVCDEEVGIDIEVFRPAPLKLAKRICTEKELIYIFGHMPEEFEYNNTESDPVFKRFFEIWTAKEAYFKCIGKGITDLSKLKSLQSDFAKIKILTDKYVIHIVKSSAIK